MFPYHPIPMIWAPHISIPAKLYFPWSGDWHQQIETMSHNSAQEEKIFKEHSIGEQLNTINNTILALIEKIKIAELNSNENFILSDSLSDSDDALEKFKKMYDAIEKIKEQNNSR